MRTFCAIRQAARTAIVFTLVAAAPAQSLRRAMTWGDDVSGQLGNLVSHWEVLRKTPVPVDNLQGVLYIAAGGENSVAITAGGPLWTWGTNEDGRLGAGSTYTHRASPARAGTLAAAVAVGARHSLALNWDGTVTAWGRNDLHALGAGTTAQSSNVPIPVPGLTAVAAVAAGDAHSIALKNDGTVWTWGSNRFGELGTGSDAPDSAQPVRVADLSNIVAVSAGAAHNVALRSDGTVWAWGHNDQYQLGQGTTTDRIRRPVQVRNLQLIRRIAAGGNHNLALHNDGTVWAWGRHQEGQLGTGATSDKSTPVQVRYLTGVTAIAAGGYHSLALRQDGTVAGWGWNLSGQLGRETGDSYVPTPVTASGLGSVESIACGEEHSLAKKLDGSVWAWGENDSGQLGIGQSAIFPSPGYVYNLTNVRQVAAGGSHTLALKWDGTVYAWGLGWWGQLGNGDRWNRTEPTRAGSLTGVVAVATGATHSLALQGDGTVWAWGDNRFMQVGYGDGYEEHRTTPMKIDPKWFQGRIISIAAGTIHSLAVREDGVVFSWGHNPYGQLGNLSYGSSTAIPRPVDTSTGMAQVVAVAAGLMHSLARTANGELWAWGGNSSGQLGTATGGTNRPVRVLGLEDVTAIAAGGYHSLAVKRGGSVWAWGADEFGQLGDGPERQTQRVPVPLYLHQALGDVGPVRAVAAGEHHSLALEENGRVLAWGRSNRGQLGNGYGLDIAIPVRIRTSNMVGVISISAGQKHSIAAGSIDATPPRVTIASPNGGERLYTATSYKVSWSASNDDRPIQSIDVWFSADGGATFTGIIGCMGLSGSERTCVWTNPGPPTATGRIRVVARDTAGMEGEDISGANFSVIAGAASIKVTSPNTAVDWGIGTRQTIAWTSNLAPGEAMMLALSRDGGSTWGALGVVPNTGSYSWMVSGPETLRARIRIAWWSGSAEDASDVNFTIAPPFIRIISPNGGEQWAAGAQQTIYWTSNLPVEQTELLVLSFSSDGGATFRDLLYPANSGRCALTAPNERTTTARIRLAWRSNPGVYDVSDRNFAIAPPYIVLLRPNGGENWARSSTQEVAWLSNLPASESLDIDISTNGGVAWQWAGRSLNSGRANILVPLVTSANCLIRVGQRGTSGVADTSDGPFTIAAPYLSVIRPNGGENWAAGSARSIDWSSNIGGEVYIGFSADGGATWTTIADRAPNTGRRIWLVPSLTTTRARLQVRSLASGFTTYSDVSNADFTIGPPYLRLVSPNGGERWPVASVQRISWISNVNGSVTVAISRDGGGTWTSLFTQSASTGGSDWTVTGPACTDCRIRITMTSPALVDISDGPFMIGIILGAISGTEAQPANLPRSALLIRS